MIFDLKVYFDSNTIEGKAQEYYAVPIIDEDDRKYSWYQIKDKNENVIMEITIEEFEKLFNGLKLAVETLDKAEGRVE